MAILSGRVWITGASSGIGAATAKMLAENGRKWFYPRAARINSNGCPRRLSVQAVSPLSKRWT